MHVPNSPSRWDMQLVDDLAATFNVGRADLNVVSHHSRGSGVRAGLTVV
jgi:hypothetical protein